MRSLHEDDEKEAPGSPPSALPRLWEPRAARPRAGFASTSLLSGISLK